MQQMIDKITERLEQTIHDIIYWKTPNMDTEAGRKWKATNGIKN